MAIKKNYVDDPEEFSLKRSGDRLLARLIEIHGNKKERDSSELIALAETAAARLTDTAGSLAGLGEEYEKAANETEFCRRLDELVFECEGCGWWCDVEEMRKPQLCDECSDNWDEFGD